MSKFFAYAKRLRVLDIGALGIISFLLFLIAGILSAILLILIPIAWYILYTPLLEERLFKPRM